MTSLINDTRENPCLANLKDPWVTFRITLAANKSSSPFPLFSSLFPFFYFSLFFISFFYDRNRSLFFLDVKISCNIFFNENEKRRRNPIKSITLFAMKKKLRNKHALRNLPRLLRSLVVFFSVSSHSIWQFGTRTIIMFVNDLFNQYANILLLCPGPSIARAVMSSLMRSNLGWEGKQFRVIN